MLAGAGYLKLEDLRKIVHNLGQGLSLKTVKDLTVNVTDASSRYCAALQWPVPAFNTLS